MQMPVRLAVSVSVKIFWLDLTLIMFGPLDGAASWFGVGGGHSAGR